MAEDMMHTPGPWEVRGPRVGHTHTMRFGRFCTIATVGGHVKNTANARLIAAAPELYEALASVNKLISEAAMTGFNWRDGDWPERLFFSQQATSKALHKARGDGPQPIGPPQAAQPEGK